jgi:hypothetical protein
MLLPTSFDISMIFGCTGKILLTRKKAALVAAAFLVNLQEIYTVLVNPQMSGPLTTICQVCCQV